MDYTDFGWALNKLRAGYLVARKGWNGRHSLALQVADAHSKMTAPYIYITTNKGVIVPWLASQEDMLAKDWEVVLPASPMSEAQLAEKERVGDATPLGPLAVLTLIAEVRRLRAELKRAGERSEGER